MNISEILEESLDLYEMANLTQQDTGIPNIVIWVGADPKRHAMRIKVSNMPNRWSDDNFTITLPMLDVVGNINKQLISGKTLNDIKEWIKLNIEVLLAYEQGNVVGTREFLDMLVKINV
jgi:hypothetical protein